MNRSRWTAVATVFAMTVLGAFLLWLRSPDALASPVFYTEDGTWTGVALTNGWWHTLWSAKDGYLVVGNIALLGLATGLSAALCGSEVACAPEAVAILSYAFFGGVAAVAFIVTRGVLGRASRWVLFAVLLFVPYGESTNEILGRISNIGYSLALVAALLLFARQRVAPGPLRVLLDLGVVVCAATNPVVIPLAILVVFSGLGESAESSDATLGQRLLQRLRTNLVLVIGTVLVAILVMVRMTTATSPSRTGSLEPGHFVEVGFARSLLYPLVWMIYSHLTDVIVLLVTALLVAGLVLAVRRITNRPALTLASILAVSLALTWASTLWSRPSLTQQLGEYATTFPDRYFMGMNQLVVAILVVIFAALAGQTGVDRVVGIIALATMVVLTIAGLPRIIEFGGTRWPIAYGFSWREQICLTHAITPAGQPAVAIPIYYEGWAMILPSSTVAQAASAIGCEDESPIDSAAYPDWTAADAAPLVRATMVTDPSWRNGFARDGRRFLTPNTPGMQSAFVTGASIVMPDGSTRDVTAVTVNGQLLEVEYSAPRYRPGTSQFPFDIEVVTP